MLITWQTLKEKMENAEKELKEKEENDKVPSPPIKVEPKVGLEPDLDKYYEIFKNPEMADKEEMGQFTSLIKEKRSALVKQLVVKMSVDPAVTGKSMIFEILPKKFAEDIKSTSEETRLAQLVRASSSSSSRSLGPGQSLHHHQRSSN